MSTRAEKFRASEERSRKPPRRKKAKRKPKAETASDRAKREGTEGTGIRNVMANERNITVAYETSADDTRPSRKSTRRAGGRKKAASALERRRQLEANRPQEKAQRRKKPGRRRKPTPKAAAG